MKCDIIARQVEFEVDDPLRRRLLSSHDRALESGRYGVGKIELVVNSTVALPRDDHSQHLLHDRALGRKGR